VIEISLSGDYINGVRVVVTKVIVAEKIPPFKQLNLQEEDRFWPW